MSEITLDLIEGAEVIRTRDGLEYERTGTVSGLADIPDKYTAAFCAVLDGVGDVGAWWNGTLAGYQINAQLETIRLKPETSDIWNVKLSYKPKYPYEQAQIEVGGSLAQVQTNKDVDGIPITLSYTYPVDYPLDERKRGKTITQGGMVPKRINETVLTFSGREAASPLNKSIYYKGTVNNGGWVGMPDAEARTCTDITGKSNDGGETYEVTYVFEYRKDGWDETAVFINPDDGKPPQDLVDGVGIKPVINYTETEFNDMFDHWTDFRGVA